MLKEIISFHFVIAVFFGCIGYILYSLLVEHNIIEINVLINDNSHFGAEKEKAGVLMIFLNNLAFFSFVCCLPILNIIYFIVQFFYMGTYIHQIESLNLLQQFTLLYRHSILEIIALFIAVYISYSLLKMSLIFLKSEKHNFFYREKFKQIGVAYLLIVVLTLLGALLEGNVSVLI